MNKKGVFFLEEIAKKISLKRRLLKLFPAFKHKNYTYYFFGQIVSMAGTWLQAVAEGWLVVTLTHSPLILGIVSGLGFLPVLFFGLFGGVIVDRMDTRKIIIGTQLAQMILAFILGGLVISGHINILIVGIMAFLLGVVNAIDMPARQAFTIEMVGQEHLSSAIAVNMGTYNAARVIGPALAGILIASIGEGGAFILNGLSFLAVFIALLLMNIKSEIPENHPNAFKSIKDGLNYAFAHIYIRNLLFFTAIVSIFGWSFTTILPLIAQDTFHTDATGLGILYAAVGVGAVAGTFFISAFQKMLGVSKLIVGGAFITSLSIFLFAYTSDFYLAMLFLFFAGVGLSIVTAMTNSTIQYHVKHSLRGRVMAIFSLFLVGMMPIGSFQIGLIAEKINISTSLSYGAVIIFLYALYLLFNLPKVHRKYILD